MTLRIAQGPMLCVQCGVLRQDSSSTLKFLDRHCRSQPLQAPNLQATPERLFTCTIFDYDDAISRRFNCGLKGGV